MLIVIAAIINTSMPLNASVADGDVRDNTQSAGDVMTSLLL